MREIANNVLGQTGPSAANLAYGRLAKRISRYLDWEPDRREDGSYFWMSVIAEGWMPTSTKERPREFEFVMVPALLETLAGWD